nr:FAD-dependent oxidoreductase [Bdellovibrio sp. CKG001]
MQTHHQINPSYWQSQTLPPFTPLRRDCSTDVCIVGAGISGLTTAYLLLKNGFKVVILERDTLGNNETSRTSGHLSNILDEGLSNLIESLGEEAARKAVASHSDAIDLIEKIIQEESIHCDFRRLDGYLYLSPETNKEYLKQEAQAARRLGLHDVELQVSPAHFADFGPALRFPRQARIHSQKYVLGLLQAIQKMGGEIYTESPAIEFKDTPLTYAKTTAGYCVYAKKIVVATNVPVNDRVQIHSKEKAFRSYVIGIEVPSDSFPDILMWDTTKPYHYLRKVPDFKEGLDLLLIGGEDHRVGQEDHPESIFETLHDWALFNLGISGPMTLQWSGQIIEPLDGLAYIGKNPGDRNTYIACADSGHGLTHGTLSAMILRDLIQETPNDWAEIYSPSRFRMRSLGKALRDNMNALVQYKDRIHLRRELKNSTSKPGEGRLLHQGPRTFAIYTDKENKTYTMNAVCPHLGGIVHWNAAEKTWDCPCHGSRFSCTGEVLNGPAISDLKSAVPKASSQPQPSEHATEERNEHETRKERDSAI